MRTASAANALEGPVSDAVRRLLLRLEDISGQLAAGEIQPQEWQGAITASLDRVDLPDLMRALDAGRLASAKVPSHRELIRPVAFPPAAGLPAEPSFSPFLFLMDKAHAVVPHGHHNMVSMHMVLTGSVRARHFDRVDEDARFLTIRETRDEIQSPGGISTISDQRDNVHWFVADSARVLLFNMQIWGLSPDQNTSGRDYIDPMSGEILPGDLIRAPRLTEHEAYARYRNQS
jgi:hypothetical protein